MPQPAVPCSLHKEHLPYRKIQLCLSVLLQIATFGDAMMYSGLVKDTATDHCLTQRCLNNIILSLNNGFLLSSRHRLFF